MYNHTCMLYIYIYVTPGVFDHADDILVSDTLFS